MNDKKYKSINEVSELLNINKHVIRYWDSKLEGISIRLSNSKRRFFNNNHIKKLQDLKNILYQNGKHYYSLDLAKDIINKKNNISDNLNSFKENTNILNKNIDINKLIEISNDLKKII